MNGKEGMVKDGSQNSWFCYLLNYGTFREGSGLGMKITGPGFDMLSLQYQRNIQVESLCRQLHMFVWSYRFDRFRYIKINKAKGVNAFTSGKIPCGKRH